uniref:Uncharacterized protein n=1 Tax=viral metagenome TaxID=1070528 RepID=A0A6M3KQ53_9ZZZZ
MISLDGHLTLDEVFRCLDHDRIGRVHLATLAWEGDEYAVIGDPGNGLRVLKRSEWERIRREDMLP